MHDYDVWLLAYELVRLAEHEAHVTRCALPARMCFGEVAKAFHVSHNPNVIIRDDRQRALTIADLTPTAIAPSSMTDAEVVAQRTDPKQGVIVISLSDAADAWLLRDPDVRRIYKLTSDEWSRLDADPRSLLAAHFADTPRVMPVPWYEARLLVSSGFAHAVISDGPTELSGHAVVWPELAFAPAPIRSTAMRTDVHIARYGGEPHDRDSQLALIAFLRARPSTATCSITGQLDDAEAELLERVAERHGASERVFIHLGSGHRISAETVVALRDDRDQPLDPYVLGAVEQGCSLITLGWPEERACCSNAHFLVPLNPPLAVTDIAPEGRAMFLAAHRGAVFADLERALSAAPLSTRLRSAPALAASLLAPTLQTPALHLPTAVRSGPRAVDAGTQKPLRYLVENPGAAADPRWLARALKLGLVSPK